MSKSLHKVLALVGLIVWMGLIYYLSDQPGLSTGSAWDFWIRKAAHIFEYGVLALLVYANAATWKWKKRGCMKCMLGVAFVVSFLYAISDEIHQTFVPNRTGKVSDVIIDTIGIGLGLLVAYGPSRLYDRLKRKK